MDSLCKERVLQWIAADELAQRNVVLRFEPEKGRFLVAKRNLRENELVLSSEPYFIFVNDPRKASVCDQCLAYDEEMIDRTLDLFCEKCKEVFYCSKECQYIAWHSYHKWECKFFQNLQLRRVHANHNRNRQLLCLGRALIRIVSNSELNVRRVDRKAIKKNENNCIEKDESVIKAEGSKIVLKAHCKLSEEIREEASLWKECNRMTMQDRDNIIDDRTTLDLLSSALFENARDEKASIKEETIVPFLFSLEDLDVLCSNVDRLPEKKLALLEPLCKSVHAVLSKDCPSLTTRQIMELACREECNTFGLYYPLSPWDSTLETSFPKAFGEVFERETLQRSLTADDDRRMFAFGIFLLPSFTNHSCAPNLYKTLQVAHSCSQIPLPFRKCAYQFRALREIAAGEELLHSYLDLAHRNTVNQRRQQLWLHYGFRCECIRCCAVDDNNVDGRDLIYEEDRFAERFLCKRFECGGLLLRTASPGSQSPTLQEEVATELVTKGRTKKATRRRKHSQHNKHPSNPRTPPLLVVQCQKCGTFADREDG